MHVLDRPPPLVIAHRGASAWAPENTPRAFDLAVEAGADAIETDLWLTRDGHIVCHHDRTLDRVTDRAGAIPEMTLSEVRAARVTGSYAAKYDLDDIEAGRIPTLIELLDRLPENVGLFAELKDPALAEPARAAALTGALAPRIAARTVLFLSFHEALLWAVRNAAPEAWIGLVQEAEPHPRFTGDGVGTSPEAMHANPEYMAEARRRGLWVCPLDPEPEPRLEWYLALGVDAVLSHDPHRTRARLDELRAGS
jgi:glycerophosphoryl diester phosphodiesterase